MTSLKGDRKSLNIGGLWAKSGLGVGDIQGRMNFKVGRTVESEVRQGCPQPQQRGIVFETSTNCFIGNPLISVW